MKYTKEALQDLANRVSKGEHPPIPLYDKPIGQPNRKKIGEIIQLWYEDGQLKYEGQLD